MIEVGSVNQDAPITLIRDILDSETADQAFATLLAELPWERRTTQMYGKDVPVPRVEMWIADHPYTHSRSTYQPQPWTPTLVKIKTDIEAATGTEFNSVLVNRYESGSDSVGWHADDEPEMSQEHPIASLSLGATRSFQIRKPEGSKEGEEMKRILEIEITQPSTFPVVFNEETDSIPVGTEVHVYCQDAKSLWSGATWKGKIVGVRGK